MKVLVAQDVFGAGDCRTVETIYKKQINAYMILDVLSGEEKKERED